MNRFPGYAKEVEWLFEQYRKRKIAYCILRNYEYLPQVLGHDIDVLIAKFDWNRNLVIMHDFEKEFGLTLFKRVEMPYSRRYYFRSGGKNVNLILDFHFDEQWMGAIYADYFDVPKARRANMVVAERFVVPLLPFLTSLLSTATINDKYFSNLVTFARNHEAKMKKMLNLILGRNLGSTFYRKIRDAERTGIKALTNKVRFYVFGRSMVDDPVGTSSRLTESLLKILWYKRIKGIYPP